MDKYKLSEWTHSTVIDRTDGDACVQIYRLHDGSDARCKVVGDAALVGVLDMTVEAYERIEALLS